MKKFIITLLIVLNITITSCYATSWVQIDEHYFIDKDSIKIYVDEHGYKNYNKRIFWTKHEGDIISKENEKKDDIKIEFSLSQDVIDFSNNTIAIKTITDYDKEGNVVLRISKQDYQLEYHSILPDSRGAAFAKLVKNPRLLKKMYKWQQSQLLRAE